MRRPAGAQHPGSIVWGWSFEPHEFQMVFVQTRESRKGSQAVSQNDFEPQATGKHCATVYPTGGVGLMRRKSWTRGSRVHRNAPSCKLEFRSFRGSEFFLPANGSGFNTQDVWNIAPSIFQAHNQSCDFTEPPFMIETRFYSSLFTRSSLCLLALLLIAAPVMAQNDRWVRIHVDERDSLTDQLSRSAELADYGGLLFGQIDEATASELRARGHRVEALDNPFLLTLGEEIFDPLERATTLTDREVEPDGDLHLIQFKGPIRPEWLERLRGHGIEIVQPLHPFSYFVWANQTQLEAAQRDRDVRWVGPMEAAWKVQPHQRIFSAEARPTMLMASAHGDLHGRIAKLRQFGQVTIVRPFGDHFMLVQVDDLPGDRYLELARLPGIFTVQYIPPDAGPRGEMSNQSIVGNIDVSGNVFPGYADWLNSTGYDGSGITVGVVDGLVRSSHVDLADRMVPCAGMNDSCSGGSTSAHGTHVAGAIAGTGA